MLSVFENIGRCLEKVFMGVFSEPDGRSLERFGWIFAFVSVSHCPVRKAYLNIRRPTYFLDTFVVYHCSYSCGVSLKIKSTYTEERSFQENLGHVLIHDKEFCSA